MTEDSIGARRACLYSSSTISTLNAAGDMLGVDFNCALVYNDAAQSWTQWDDPWFITSSNPNVNWSAWVRSAPGRTMILSIPLFPKVLDGSSWLSTGAAGDFDHYDRTLARNLVAAGLGSSVIRLAWEANGTWYPDRVGDTRATDARWVTFWRDTARSMMSVPGAHFSFDWCVNAGDRDIPLADFYPGNDVVDEIGVDFYDAGLPSVTNDRWSGLYDEPDGLRSVLAFARRHGKPISIPEWGVSPTAAHSGRSDATYVKDIADVVKADDVAYQSYFFTGDWAQSLASYPGVLTAYRAAFGNRRVTETPAGTLASLPAPLPLL